MGSVLRFPPHVAWFLVSSTWRFLLVPFQPQPLLSFRSWVKMKPKPQVFVRSREGLPDSWAIFDPHPEGEGATPNDWVISVLVSRTPSCPPEIKRATGRAVIGGFVFLFVCFVFLGVAFGRTPPQSHRKPHLQTHPKLALNQL